MKDDPEAVARLLDGYGRILDSLAMRPPSIFLSAGDGFRARLGRSLLLPGANFTASILATRHIAAQVDILLGRGLRLRALHPQDPNPVDFDRLQDFRNSLSPVTGRTLVLWIVVLTLAVAFPVAWITDHIRNLAPELIVCSSRFSARAVITRFVGTTTGPVIGGCRLRQRDSLLDVLAHIAHLNVSPGGVIDAFTSAKAGGIVALLLLTVVWILSLWTVLLIFKSGFRLKRLAFSAEGGAAALDGLPSWSDVRSDGLYLAENEAFNVVGLPPPREFPLDLVVRAGILALPMTIAVDLLHAVLLTKLDVATRDILAVGALALIALIAIRLVGIVRVWRSRIGTRLILPRRRWLPDGSTVLVTGCARTALIMTVGFVVLEISAVLDPGISFTGRVFSILLFAPLFVWSLGSIAWYRMRCELASYGRYTRVVRPGSPLLAVLAPASLAVASLMAYIWIEPASTPAFVEFVVAILFLVGLIGMPLSIYRMGRDVEQLRRYSADRDRRARAAGMLATLLVFLPFVAILYFRHSLERIFAQITTSAP